MPRPGDWLLLQEGLSGEPARRETTKGSDFWGAESPLVMKCPFFRLSMTWHLPKSLCLGFFKIYTLANIMGFLFSVSFLCECTFYHSFDKLGNCLDNLCFEWGKLFFSNNTDMITTIHLWNFFSRYSVRSAPCSVERRHWCAARSNKRFMLYDFFELMLYDFELVVMCIRTCYKFQWVMWTT